MLELTGDWSDYRHFQLNRFHFSTRRHIANVQFREKLNNSHVQFHFSAWCWCPGSGEMVGVSLGLFRYWNISTFGFKPGFNFHDRLYASKSQLCVLCLIWSPLTISKEVYSAFCLRSQFLSRIYVSSDIRFTALIIDEIVNKYCWSQIYHTVDRLRSFLSLGQLVTRSLSHSVTCHLVTWSLGHSVTMSFCHSVSTLLLTD